MSYLPEAEVGKDFEPFAVLRSSFGFIPRLFRAQTLLPRAIEAEVRLLQALIFRSGSLSRVQKERILLAGAAAQENLNCLSAHWQMLRFLRVSEAEVAQIVSDFRQAELPPEEIALLDFCGRLARNPAGAPAEEFRILRRHRFDNPEILETVILTAWSRFLCALSSGLGIRSDFPVRSLPARRISPWAEPREPRLVPPGPPEPPARLPSPDLEQEPYPPFMRLREKLGFVPDVLRAQTLRPDCVEAEAVLLETVLVGEASLDRGRKGLILRQVLSAVSVIDGAESARRAPRPSSLAEEPWEEMEPTLPCASLSASDTALVDATMKLAGRPKEFGGADIEALLGAGFRADQILEALLTTALAVFFDTLERGLGTAVNFETRTRRPA